MYNTQKASLPLKVVFSSETLGCLQNYEIKSLCSKYYLCIGYTNNGENSLPDITLGQRLR